jgi:hypothetical protein
MHADYVDHISCALETIESSIASLQEELWEVHEIVTLLADLESTNSIEEVNREATAPPVAPEPTSRPQLPVAQSVQELMVAQPIQQAVRFSNREQLALAQQRARDWAARELNWSRRSQQS